MTGGPGAVPDKGCRAPVPIVGANCVRPFASHPVKGGRSRAPLQGAKSLMLHRNDMQTGEPLRLSILLCHCEASAHTGCGNPRPRPHRRGELRSPAHIAPRQRRAIEDRPYRARRVSCSIAMTCRQGSRCGCRFSSVIAKPVRTLAVAIRAPRPIVGAMRVRPLTTHLVKGGRSKIAPTGREESHAPS